MVVLIVTNTMYLQPFKCMEKTIGINKAAIDRYQKSKIRLYHGCWLRHYSELRHLPCRNQQLLFICFLMLSIFLCFNILFCSMKILPELHISNSRVCRHLPKELVFAPSPLSLLQLQFWCCWHVCTFIHYLILYELFHNAPNSTVLEQEFC